MVSLTIDSCLLDVYSREKGPYPVTNFPQNMTHTLHAWKADHLRFSLFSNDVIQEPVEAIYSRISGEQASEVSKKPASGENSAIGVHEDFKFELRCTFNRIDLILSPAYPSALEVSLITRIEDSVGKLRRLASQLTKGRSDLIRLAFGGHYLFEVENPIEGYKKLSEMTRQNFDFEKHRDVNFQINIPKKAKSDSTLFLNRLTRWACPSIEVHAISSMSSVRKSYFCGCLADFNTDGDRNIVFEEEVVNSLILELTDEMLNFVSQGINP